MPLILGVERELKLLDYFNLHPLIGNPAYASLDESEKYFSEYKDQIPKQTNIALSF